MSNDMSQALATSNSTTSSKQPMDSGRDVSTTQMNNAGPTGKIIVQTMKMMNTKPQSPNELSNDLLTTSENTSDRKNPEKILQSENFEK